MPEQLDQMDLRERTVRVDLPRPDPAGPDCRRGPERPCAA